MAENMEVDPVDSKIQVIQEKTLEPEFILEVTEHGNMHVSTLFRFICKTSAK